MFTEEPIKKTEMLSSGANTEESTNNGISFLSVNGKKKLKKRPSSSAAQVASKLVNHSTLCQECQSTELLKAMETETFKSMIRTRINRELKLRHGPSMAQSSIITNIKTKSL